MVQWHLLRYLGWYLLLSHRGLVEDGADGVSNCLSWIPFLSCLWLHFYLRITHATVISGFSTGIGMWEKWEAIAKRPWKHVNYRSFSHSVATIHCFVYCFIMEMMCKWVSAKPIQPNGSQTITVSFPIIPSISFSYSRHFYGWEACLIFTFTPWIKPQKGMATEKWSRKLAFPCIVWLGGERKRKTDGRWGQMPKNALVRVVMAGGRDVREGGWTLGRTGKLI